MARRWDILAIDVFDGPNPSLPCRALRARLGVAAEVLLPSHLGQILSALDSLRPRRNDRPGPLLAELAAAQAAVPVGAVIVAVALELQRMFGDDTERAMAIPVDGDGTCLVAFETEQEGIARLALRAALTMVAHAVAGKAQRPEAVDAFVARAGMEARNSMIAPLMLEAARRGIPVQRLHKGDRFLGHARFGHGRYQRQCIGSITDGTSSVAGTITGSKSQTVLALQRLGLPVPRQHVVGNLRDARAAADRLGYPVVVKPDRGTGGGGITAGVGSPGALEDAFARAHSRCPLVVVEEMLPGEDHRLLVCGGRLVSATQRCRAAVLGDGRTTVADLIAAENADPRRGVSDLADLSLIEIDEQLLDLLAEQGSGLESVPDAGERVLLRTTANLDRGATLVAVDDRVHPDNRRLAEIAARGLCLDVAGVDLLIPDIAVSYLDQPCGIVEVNVSPGLAYGSFPEVFAKVVDAILGELFPPGSRSRMPLVVVVGAASGEGPATVSALARGLVASGLSPAWYDGADLHIAMARHATGLPDHTQAAAMILAHPLPDDLGAVVAVAAGGSTSQGGGDPAGLLDVVLAMPAMAPRAG